MSEPDEIQVAREPGQVAALWGRTSWRVLIYVAGCIVLGALAGLLWAAVTPRASYTVQEDLSALISERGQSMVAAADVTFTLISLGLGLIVGVLGWVSLHRRGWLVIVATVLASVAATIMAWRFGMTVGPQDFVERLAAAEAGDVVAKNLELRSLSALLVTPFAAVTPIMLLSAFWPEPVASELPPDHPVAV